ncbi:MAG: riboflavin synthase [Bacteroidota bacterium]|nr:riboflavin synthase [Bacteroidota bacterium]
MFTGIIESLGEITEISIEESNRVFFIKSDITSHLQVDQSISHNGICLTVEDIKKDIYKVTAIKETLEKTNARLWNPGDIVNLERSMKMNGRLDGHIVQGHVDGTAICTAKKDKEGSVEFTFEFIELFSPLIIEKGSVCINGVSLTAFSVRKHSFTVAIIPYTFSHTNFKNIMEADVVNIEFDILGKYVQRILALQSK